MFTRLSVDASERDRIGQSWNDVTIPSLEVSKHHLEVITFRFEKIMKPW